MKGALLWQLLLSTGGHNQLSVFNSQQLLFFMFFHLRENDYNYLWLYSVGSTGNYICTTKDILILII